MRIRLGWAVATAAAYGFMGGELLFSHVWELGEGLTWTSTALLRLAWAAAVFLFSTVWLAHRNPSGSARWMSLHAAAAFMLGAAATWLMLEYRMAFNEHGWDTDAPSYLRCIDCVPRAAIIRQAVIASLMGSTAAAGLAPLVARLVRHVGVGRVPDLV